MGRKAAPFEVISEDEFAVALLLNLPTAKGPDPNVVRSVQRVMVQGLEPKVARADLPDVTKQVQNNLLARLRKIHQVRVAQMTVEQFELCVSLACPELRGASKKAVREYLVNREPTGQKPIKCEDSIAKILAMHRSILRAYALK